MSGQTFSTFTEVGMIDARLQAGAITLPTTTSIPYRILTLKDVYGATTQSTVTIQTQAGDTFEDGTTSRALNASWASMSLYAGVPGIWYTIGGSVLTSASISSLTVSSIYGLQGFVSTPYLETQVGSTVVGLGTAGYISSSQLLSTSLGLTEYISSFIDPTELTSTVVGLGTQGFVSSLGLTYAVASTAQGLGTFGYTSTSQLLSTSLGLYQQMQASVTALVQADLTSTVIGLGTVGYISTVTLGSLVSTANLANHVSTANLATLVSTANLANHVSTANLANLVSTANLANHVSTANLANLVSTANLANHVSTANLANLVSTNYLATQLGSTVIGLGSAGYLSTGFSTLISQAFFTSSLSTTNINTANINSLTATISSLTVNALFIGTGTGFTDIGDTIGTSMSTITITANTITAITLSTQQLNVSSITGISIVSQTNLTSTVIGLGTAGYLSSVINGLISTANLTNLVSTANLANLVSTANLTNFVSTANLTNLVSTANLANLVSTIYIATQLGSTVIGLGTAGYISSSQLLSTSLGLTQYMSSFIDPTELTSTVVGLGTQGFVSSLGLTYAVASTAQGLGTFGYTSTSQLLSTSLGLYQEIQNSPVNIKQSNVTSTIIGLGTFGYLSTVALGSLISTANLANLVSTANLVNLVSTANLANLVSTANLANYVSTTYLSTQLGSTFATLTVSSLSTFSLQGTNAFISSLTVNGLFAGTAVIGTPSAYGNNFAYFGNNVLPANGSEYALLHEFNGTTFLNCSSGRLIRFRQNNVDIFTADAGGIYMNANLNMCNNNINNIYQLNFSNTANIDGAYANQLNFNATNSYFLGNLRFFSTGRTLDIADNIIQGVSYIYGTSGGFLTINAVNAMVIENNQGARQALNTDGSFEFRTTGANKTVYINADAITFNGSSNNRITNVSTINGVAYPAPSGAGVWASTATTALNMAGFGINGVISISGNPNLRILGTVFTSNTSNWTNGSVNTLYGSEVLAGKYIQWSYDNNPGTGIYDNCNIRIDAPNITIQGTLNLCNANINNAGIISSLNVYAGTAVIGTPSAYGNTYAYFGNNSLAANGGEYALLQQNNGTTFLNCKLNETIRFRNGNYDIMTLDSVALNMLSNNITNVNTISALSTQQITITQTSGSDFVLFNNGDTRQNAKRDAYVGGDRDVYVTSVQNMNIRAPDTQYITIQQTGAGNQSYLQFASGGNAVLNSRTYIELVSQQGSNGIYLTGSFTECRGYLTFNTSNNYINNVRDIYGDTGASGGGLAIDYMYGLFFNSSGKNANLYIDAGNLNMINYNSGINIASYNSNGTGNFSLYSASNDMYLTSGTGRDINLNGGRTVSINAAQPGGSFGIYASTINAASLLDTNITSGQNMTLRADQPDKSITCIASTINLNGTVGVAMNLGGAVIQIAGDRNIYFTGNGTSRYANFQDTNVAFNTGTPGSLLMNMNGNDIINVRTLTASNSSSPVIFSNATSAANSVVKCEMTGANFIIRQSANASAIAVIENTGGGGLLINPLGTGNIGIGSSNISFPLDVFGAARSGIPISSLTGIAATFANSSYGIYYYITNSAFATINLVGGAPSPAAGWYVTLRNNTGSYLSCTITGAVSSTPASPVTIPPSNSVTIAYDSATSLYVLF